MGKTLVDKMSSSFHTVRELPKVQERTEQPRTDWLKKLRCISYMLVFLCCWFGEDCSVVIMWLAVALPVAYIFFVFSEKLDAMFATLVNILRYILEVLVVLLLRILQFLLDRLLMCLRWLSLQLQAKDQAESQASDSRADDKTSASESVVTTHSNTTQPRDCDPNVDTLKGSYEGQEGKICGVTDKKFKLTLENGNLVLIFK